MIGGRIFKKKGPARLENIFVADAAGESMTAIKSAEVVTGKGIVGDRYYNQCGHWKTIEACEITLITRDDLIQSSVNADETIVKRLERGSHRRNLVISGIKTKQLEGRRFEIGNAEFQYLKPRPPCGYIDQVSGRGTCKALAHNSGICITVVKNGTIMIGDTLNIIQ